MRTPLAFLLSLVLLSVSGFSATLNVPAQYPTIQAGIDAAAKGDTVLVAPGTYFENIDFKGKAITLTSEQGPNVTTIDGSSAGIVVACETGEDQNTKLDGFTIANGRHASNAGGGGMRNDMSSPTVTNCVFLGSYSYNGGGMLNSGGNPTITKCVFKANIGSFSGGGMQNNNNSPTISDCVFLGNHSACFGGGMHNYNSTPKVTNCVFIANWVAETSCAQWGGGMNNDCSNATVTNCTFVSNISSSLGGGMFNQGCSPTIANCTFRKNVAIQFGGAMYNQSGSNPVLSNSVVWENTFDEIVNDSTSVPAVTYCCIYGGYPGTGNISADPLFVDYAGDDYHLTYFSPCRDAGDNAAVIYPYDFEGDPRIAYGTVDMGADEFHKHLYFTGNPTPGGTVSLKLVGIPSIHPVGLILGLSAFESPLPTTLGEWYMKTPFVLLPLLGPIPPNGVLVLSGAPCSTATPYTIYGQAVINYKLSNLMEMKIK